MANKNLIEAKRNKKDEFYTLYKDIHNEVKHYKDQLEGKVVYCNTDDPRYSNFWKYFYDNFENYRLKKLISTYYSETEPVYKTTYDGKEIKKERLEGNGSFDSPEALDVLKEADAVITNPPFSKYRQFFDTLVSHEVDFLIIGNNNSITYKNVFPFIKDDIVKIGYTANKTLEFMVDKDYVRKVYERESKYYTKVQSITWFTTLEVKSRPFLKLDKKYDPEKYAKYDNYDAIEVSRVKDIPYDYEGVMGVPITFLSKHNKEQFSILGATESEGKGMSFGLWDPTSHISQPLINGVKRYKRIFIIPLT